MKQIAKSREDIYTYKTQAMAPHGKKEDRIVHIRFKDHEFKSVSFDATGPYSLSEWKMMADINKKLVELLNKHTRLKATEK